MHLSRIVREIKQSEPSSVVGSCVVIIPLHLRILVNCIDFVLYDDSLMIEIVRNQNVDSAIASEVLYLNGASFGDKIKIGTASFRNERFEKSIFHTMVAVRIQ